MNECINIKNEQQIEVFYSMFHKKTSVGGRMSLFNPTRTGGGGVEGPQSQTFPHN